MIVFFKETYVHFFVKIQFDCQKCNILISGTFVYDCIFWMEVQKKHQWHEKEYITESSRFKQEKHCFPVGFLEQNIRQRVPNIVTLQIRLINQRYSTFFLDIIHFAFGTSIHTNTTGFITALQFQCYNHSSTSCRSWTKLVLHCSTRTLCMHYLSYSTMSVSNQ